eukprot:TRINITY_DN1011_c0_g1_i1.p1 TRINITY_DN1011_c0_g1~~TRINITY_DN1011_c0_g1_i1.p1  ORF type:complete len:1089 (+),score=331.80 TRINITY_DN1011_c0_g1_i1:441-3269(+)
MAPAQAICMVDGKVTTYKISSNDVEGVVEDPTVKEQLNIWRAAQDSVGGQDSLHVEYDSATLRADPGALIAMNFARGSDKVMGFHGDNHHAVRVMFNYTHQTFVNPPSTRPHYTHAPTPAPPPGHIGQCTRRLAGTVSRDAGELSWGHGEVPGQDPVYCNVHFHIHDAWLHWIWNGVDEYIQWTLESKSNGWLALSFAETEGKMAPALAIILTEDRVKTYRIHNASSAGIVEDISVRSELEIMSMISTPRTENGEHVRSMSVHMKSDRMKAFPAINIARHMDSYSLEDTHKWDQRVGLRLNFHNAQEFFYHDVHAHNCSDSGEDFAFDGDASHSSDKAPLLCQYDVPVLDNTTFHYSYTPNSEYVKVKVLSDSSGWLAVGFADGPNAMHPALAVVLDGEDPAVRYVRLQGKALSDVVEDEAIEKELDVRDVVFTRAGGRTELQFQLNYERLPAFHPAMTQLNITIARDLERVVMDQKHDVHERVAFRVNVEQPIARNDPYTPEPTLPTRKPRTFPPPDPNGPTAIPHTAVPPTEPPRGVCAPSELEEYHCRLAGPEEKFALHWVYNPLDSTVKMAVSIERSTWLGVAFPDEYGEMAPAKGIITDDSGTHYYRFDSESDAGVVRDASVGDALRMVPGGDHGATIRGTTTVHFKRWVGADFMKAVAINVAWGDDHQYQYGNHGVENRASLEVRFEDGFVQLRAHDRHIARRVHAFCMVLGFLFLLPLAVLVKRYPEKMPCCGYKKGDPGSFGWHQCIAILAVVVIAVGYGVAKTEFEESEVDDEDDHGAAGTLLFIMVVVLQPLLGVLSVWCFPKEHSFSPTLRTLHKVLAVCIMLVAGFSLLTGVSKLKELDDSSFPKLLGVVVFLVALPLYCGMLYVLGTQGKARFSKPAHTGGQPQAYEMDDHNEPAPMGDMPPGEAPGLQRTNSIPIGYREDVTVSRDAY